MADRTITVDEVALRLLRQARPAIAETRERIGGKLEGALMTVLDAIDVMEKATPTQPAERGELEGQFWVIYICPRCGGCGVEDDLQRRHGGPHCWCKVEAGGKSDPTPCERIKVVPASTHPLDLDAKDKRIAELEARLAGTEKAGKELLDTAEGMLHYKEEAEVSNQRRIERDDALADLHALKERLTSDEACAAGAAVLQNHPVERAEIVEVRKEIEAAWDAAFPDTEQGDGT